MKKAEYSRLPGDSDEERAANRRVSASSNETDSEDDETTQSESNPSSVENSQSEDDEAESTDDSDLESSNDDEKELKSDNGGLPTRLKAKYQVKFRAKMEKMPNATLFVVMSDFKATKSDELSIYKNERVVVLADDGDDGSSEFVKVQTADKKTGLVPRQCLGDPKDKSNLRREAPSVDATLNNNNNDRMVPEKQESFRKQLTDGGKRICISIADVKDGDFEAKSGEAFEVLEAIGTDEYRVVNCDGETGILKRKLVFDVNAAPTTGSQERSPRARSTGGAAAASSSPNGSLPRTGSRRRNDYVEVKKVGSGTYGSAYLVTRKRDGRQVVIKSVDLDGKNDAKINKEAEFLRSHPHKFIVRFLGSFTENGKLYIETEFCSRGNLRSLINERRKENAIFQEYEIAKWTFQLSLALQHLHMLGILHRDVKAENVFLAENFDVKLGDMGAAAKLNSTLVGSQANTMIGTFPYLAPEIADDQPYGLKVDVWSLGVLVYFLTELSYPFGESMTSVIKALQGRERPPKVTGDRSRALVKFIDKLLTYDPDKRPDCDRVLADRFLASQTLD